MGDTISRETTKKTLAHLVADHMCKRSKTHEIALSVLDAIDNMPAVDAEPVRRGEWVHLGGDEWCCNMCGDVIHTEGSWEKPKKKYCSECGARMTKEETNE